MILIPMSILCVINFFQPNKSHDKYKAFNNFNMYVFFITLYIIYFISTQSNLKSLIISIKG